MGDADFEGWLQKAGGMNGKTNQKRYFVLAGATLYYYKEKPKLSQRPHLIPKGTEQGIMDLTGTQYCEPIMDLGASTDGVWTLSGGTLKKTYTLTAADNEERAAWIAKLRTAGAVDMLSAMFGTTDPSDENEASSDEDEEKVPPPPAAAPVPRRPGGGTAEEKKDDLDDKAKVFEAAKFGKKDQIEFGMKVRIKDDDGWTPLHFAAHNGHIETAEALYALGADVTARTNEGGTPFDVAQNDDMRRMLDAWENP